ncbi:MULTISPECIES: hypothetical protein [Rhodobacterales]|uniref:hypothetical protein n=1 Tax=Rhodobacterales TaxID=204455 RepID=UPI00215D76EC|nr:MULTISPECIES: hypothetical protein [Rhodobacterales]MDO6590058.1 hypothetical protein [Yoonia sp. 1_MG-2023]
MAAVTHACTIDYVATKLGEDVALLQAIISNDDHMPMATSSASMPVLTKPSMH